MNKSSSINQTLAVILLSFVTIIWGASFIFVKWTIQEVDVYYFLFVRFLLAFLILAITFYKRILKVDLKTIRASLILGTLLFIIYATQTEGLRFTTASNSALITGLYLVFIPIFLVIFYKTKSNIFSIVGVVCSFIGMYLLTKYSFHGVNIGDFLTLICAVASAWHIILTGIFVKKYNVIPLVCFEFLIIAILSGVITFVKGEMVYQIPQIALFTIILTAIFCSVFAFLVQGIMQRVVDPTRIGIIFALEGAFGAFFGWWLGNEILTTISLIGACLMFLGMVISEMRSLFKKSTKGIYYKIPPNPPFPKGGI